jgi:hypothetical protein
MKMNKVVLLVPALAMLLLGCPVPQESDESVGSLTITLPPTSMQSGKTPDPMAVTSYDVDGAGPADASFQRLGATAGTLTVTGLRPGDWGVTVSGNNTEGAHVASGTVRVKVVAGETASKDVVVSPVTGTGTLAVTMKWPPGQLKDPLVRGTLTPRGGLPTAITLALQGEGLSGFTGIACAAGYYTLTLSLLDGESVICGGAEAIRVSADSETTVAFAFTPSAGSNSARLSMTVDPELSNDLRIAFTGQQCVLIQGTTMTVKSDLSGKVRSYQWYLNGALLEGQESPSITLGSALAPGSYRLDLVVSTNSALASENVLFSVARPDEKVQPQ